MVSPLKKPRFSLRILFLLLTVTCLAVGYAVSRVKHEMYVANLSTRAESLIATSFTSTPAGFEVGHVPWASQTTDEFDRAYYDAWLAEIRAKPRLKGFHRFGHYDIVTIESNSPRGELEGKLLSHFGTPLRSLGFELADTREIEQVSHGQRKLVTLTHPESGLEADLRFVFGRNGFTFVAIDVGAE